MARMAEIVQWSGHLVVAEKTWVRFPVSADLSFFTLFVFNIFFGDFSMSLASY